MVKIPHFRMYFYSQSDSISAYDSIMYVPLKDLIDTYTAGDGLSAWSVLDKLIQYLPSETE